jgi:hypothetical protein
VTVETHLDVAKAAGLTMLELETAGRVIKRVAATYNVSAAQAVRLVTQGDMAHDLREAVWRVRLRLYDDADTLLADSDEGTDETLPGAEVLRGMASVWAWAADLICHFQPAVDRGQLIAALQARAATARVAVSRGHGAGHFSVPYTCDEALFFARFDLVRKTQAA